MATDGLYYIGQDALAVVGVLGFALTGGTLLIRSFWKRVDARISALDEKATPNGKDTLAVGDTAARVEDKVDEIRDLLLAHIRNHPGVSPSTYSSEVLPLAQGPKRSEIEHKIEQESE